ncbi:MAG: hypothetical protein DRO07_01045 [Candidatus Iainarchaeum archaeon]|uniref:AAA ATPase AAA+ lid domain-containing protein n=1 Tax=Candidatus Iainarchaeum sp. TaxID=3101447 RepID=A0A497JHX5_9ARCH|nr:MAG: hypothetical protein DRO07_01045 [Candidatus Diapherotrites archaeon]
MPLAKDVSLKKLAELTEGFSGADLEGLVREAVLLAIKENRMKKTTVKHKHFDKALSKMRPSISESTRKAYEEFKARYAEFTPTYVR